MALFASLELFTNGLTPAKEFTISFSEIESKKYTEDPDAADVARNKGYLRIFIVETFFNICKILFSKRSFNKLANKLLSINEGR